MERRGRVLPFVWSRRRCPVRGASGRQGARARLPLPRQNNIRRRFAVIIVGRESDSVKATFALRVGQSGTSPLASAEHAALWIRLRHAPSGCRLRLQQRSLFRLFETIFAPGLLLFLSKSADGRSLSRSSHWRWLSFTDALWRDEAGEGGSDRMTLGGQVTTGRTRTIPRGVSRAKRFCISM
jgi:hypothetical protein